MPYEDWEPSFQELFDSIPGTGEPDVDLGYAEALFETAWTHDAAELDAMGYDPDEIDAIRDAFYDYMGIDASDIDWDTWREAMGYDLVAHSHPYFWRQLMYEVNDDCYINPHPWYCDAHEIWSACHEDCPECVQERINHERN